MSLTLVPVLTLGLLTVPAGASEMGKPGTHTRLGTGSHAAVIDANGSLWMWGSNGFGQLGNGGGENAEGKTYTPNGTELKTPFAGERPYVDASAATKVNGQAAQLSAFVLTDDAGGGYTYYKLRDLGAALGFNVDWSAERGVFIETDKPYGGAN